MHMCCVKFMHQSLLLTYNNNTCCFFYREVRRLRYLFLYIFSYFMFSDAVNTINSMISIVQGEITSFSAQQVTLLNLISAVCSIIGCLVFLVISQKFGVKTKTNLLIILTLSAVVPVWGCFGIGLDNFGIKVRQNHHHDCYAIPSHVHVRIDTMGIVGVLCLARLVYCSNLCMATNHVG